MKNEVSSTMNDLLSKMLNVDPEDVLTPEEIRAHLTEAFNKFDKDGSGQLGNWEFMQAWIYLGLKGSEDEIQKAFVKVGNSSTCSNFVWSRFSTDETRTTLDKSTLMNSARQSKGKECLN